MYGWLPTTSLMQVSTGVAATVDDPVLSASAGLISDYDNKGGARNLLGAVGYDIDSKNRILLYKYVQLVSTAIPSLIVGPVYFTDNTFQIVSPVSTEGAYGVNGVAGILLNASATYNNYVYIQIFGFLAGMVVAGSTAIGDALIGTSGNQLTARVAANTAPTNTVVAMALTAVSSTKSDVLITVGLGGLTG
jgi:hypothetical protein